MACSTPSALSRTSTLRDLLHGKRDLIAIAADEPVSKALEVMQRNKIRSIGLVEDGSVTGILNLMDVIVYLSFGSFAFQDDSRTEAPNLDEKESRDLLTLDVESSRLWWKYSYEKIDRVLDLMSLGVHRILVKMDDDDKAKLCTQTDILHYLASTLDEHKKSGVKPDVTKSLSQLGLANKQKVHSIKHDDPAIDGFRKIVQNRVSAVCVLDCQGHIVNKLSETDIRHLTPATIHLVMKPVHSFLESNGELKNRVCTVTPDETLEHIVQRFIIAKAHRLWVVDEEKKPIRAFTLSDLIYAFSTPAAFE